MVTAASINQWFHIGIQGGSVKCMNHSSQRKQSKWWIAAECAHMCVEESLPVICVWVNIYLFMYLHGMEFLCVCLCTCTVCLYVNMCVTEHQRKHYRIKLVHAFCMTHTLSFSLLYVCVCLILPEQTVWPATVSFNMYWQLINSR